MVEYIISHKNPDTDTICSAIAYGKFLTLSGVDVKVCKLGDLNKETEFVLKKFGFDVPETVTELPEGSKIVLVDHNEAKQSIDNRSRYEITRIIDHHKFDFSTKSPLFIRAEPIGSTCSIVSKMFFEAGFEIDKNLASILISAILSDTLYFRSPTCTPEDHLIVEKLNLIAQIDDLEAFSLEMFDAKSNLGNMPIEKLVSLDYKEFSLNDNKVGIGVMETTNPDYALGRKDEIISELSRLKSKFGLRVVFFSVIDILNGKNITLYSDNSSYEVLKSVFDAVDLEDGILDLGNIVSRKKQLVPKLEEYFS